MATQATGATSSAPGPKVRSPERHHRSEQAREQREGEAEQGHDRDSHRHRQPAVLDDHQRRPVDEAQRRDGPRQVTQPEAVARRCARPPGRRAAEPARPRPRGRGRTSGTTARAGRRRPWPAPRPGRVLQEASRRARRPYCFTTNGSNFWSRSCSCAFSASGRVAKVPTRTLKRPSCGVTR